jgi:olefin beta-lactone synthetase
MAELARDLAPTAPAGLNLALSLREHARLRPDRTAVAEHGGRAGRTCQVSFAQLEHRARAFQRELHQAGIGPGERVAMLCAPSSALVAACFGVLRAGAVPVFVDPGAGLGAMLDCLAQAEPKAVVAAMPARVLMALRPHFFRSVTQVLRPPTRELPPQPDLAPVLRDAGDDGAVVFTSGTTARPKGVVLHQGALAAELVALTSAFAPTPDEVDLAPSPLFALFSPALGRTAVLPKMDFGRPARVDPKKLLLAAREHRATTAFAPPSVCEALALHAERSGEDLSPLRLLVVGGAAPRRSLVERLLRALPEGGDVLVAYGQTEAVPLTTLSGRELLSLEPQGPGGPCVGRPVGDAKLSLLPVHDGPLSPSALPAALTGAGQVGEVAVSASVASRAYFRRPELDALARFERDGAPWHRTGDLGWFDEAGRLWLVGRMSERVCCSERVLYTEPWEERFEAHPEVRRAALVGLGEGAMREPVLVVEPRPTLDRQGRRALGPSLLKLAAQQGLWELRHVLLRTLPLDGRHNSKIRRHEVSRWVAKVLGQP